MLNISRLGAGLVAAVAVLAPALWNRFPLLQWDTGGYLARWFEGYLVPSRSVVYGLFLTAGWPLDFWPVVAVQAALTLWMLWLVMRTHGLLGSPWTFAAVVVALSALTTLPWVVDVLITDIFAGLSVLGLHLLVFRSGKLTTAERCAVIVLVAFSAATHSATLAVLLAVAVAAGIVALARGDLVSRAGVGRAMAALVLSVVLTLAANYVLVRRLAWTPGGYGIAFGRLLQDGIAGRYLDARCPQAGYKLCPYRHQLPPTADEFLWGNSVFDDLGRFTGLGAEMEAIVIGSIVAYPRENLEAALIAAGRQLVTVASGEGVVDTIWHTHGMIERHTPSALPAMRAARQQRGGIDFAPLNAVHVPVALASLALLPVIIVLGWRRRAFADLALLAATVMVAMVVNAAVCGILSGVHPRYGARLIWLASLVVALVPVRAAARAPVVAPPPVAAVAVRASRPGDGAARL